MNAELELAQRAVGGCELAWKELYREQHPWVYNHALRLTLNTTEAQDLTQDVFSHLLVKLHLFRGDSQLKTWIYRITLNQYLMETRSRKNTQQRYQPDYRLSSLEAEIDPEEGAWEETAAVGRTDSQLESAALRLTLIRAISKLPEGYRTTFLLHEVYGYAHYEIADMRGCSVGNSKSQLCKARAALRREME